MEKSIIFPIVFAFFIMNPVYAEDIPVARQSELKHLLLHDCGSCHGMTLKGGLGPALTPSALSGKSVKYLFQVINDGRPNTPMPPWKNILSDTDIVWLVNLLKKGLNDEK
ncbi:MAG TPA: cytochrome c [Methylophaga sp.]|nr:cytochrome c [Methylophaga sp.]